MRSRWPLQLLADIKEQELSAEFSDAKPLPFETVTFTSRETLAANIYVAIL